MIRFFSILFLLLIPETCLADREKQMIGKISAELIYASNKNSDLGEALDQKRLELLTKQEAFGGMKFRHLGKDEQKLLRSYVNWLAPLGASKQILIEFDTLGVSAGSVRLSLKLWQKDKVILKTDIELKPHKPLIIQGPAWREGRVLVVIDLLELQG